MAREGGRARDARITNVVPSSMKRVSMLSTINSKTPRRCVAEWREPMVFADLERGDAVLIGEPL